MSFQEIDIRNASVKTANIISLFPTGDYKLFFFIYDGVDNEIGQIKVICSVITEIYFFSMGFAVAAPCIARKGPFLLSLSMMFLGLLE